MPHKKKKKGAPIKADEGVLNLSTMSKGVGSLLLRKDDSQGFREKLQTSAVRN